MSTTLRTGVENTLTLSVNDITASVTSAAVSLKFIRKIIPLIIENIVYHRLNLEENLFEKKTVKDWDYMAFKSGTRNHHTMNVYWYTRSIAEAIAKQQIKKIFLFFTNKKNKEPIEHYIFDLKYKDLVPEKSVGGNTLLLHTKRLFDVVNSLSNFCRLNPDDIQIVIEFKILGPSGSASIPHFKVTSGGGLSSQIIREQSMPIGLLDTGYHQLRLTAGGTFGQDDIPEDETRDADVEATKENESPNRIVHKGTSKHPQSPIINSLSLSIPEDELENEPRKRAKRKGTPKRGPPPNSLTLLAPEDDNWEVDVSFNSTNSKRKRSPTHSFDSVIRNIDDDIQKSQSQNSQNSDRSHSFCITKKKRVEDNSATLPSQFSQIDLTMSDIGNEDSNNDTESGEIHPDNTINCSCTLNYSLGLTGTLTCMICKRTMHTICVGYQSDTNAPKSSFICLKCGSEKNPATDVKLASAKQGDINSLCSMRLVLRYCIVNKTFPKELVGMMDLKIQNKLKMYLKKVPGFKINEDNTLNIEKTLFTKFMSGFFNDAVDINFGIPESMEL